MICPRGHPGRGPRVPEPVRAGRRGHLAAAQAARLGQGQQVEEEEAGPQHLVQTRGRRHVLPAHAGVGAEEGGPEGRDRGGQQTGDEGPGRRNRRT